MYSYESPFYIDKQTASYDNIMHNVYKIANLNFIMFHPSSYTNTITS